MTLLQELAHTLRPCEGSTKFAFASHVCKRLDALHPCVLDSRLSDHMLAHTSISTYRKCSTLGVDDGACQAQGYFPPDVAEGLAKDLRKLTNADKHSDGGTAFSLM